MGPFCVFGFPLDFRREVEYILNYFGLFEQIKKWKAQATLFVSLVVATGGLVINDQD